MTHRLRQPDPPPDWVVILRLVKGDSLGSAVPTWTEGVHAVRHLLARGQSTAGVIQAMGLNGQVARDLVRDARRSEHMEVAG